MSGYSLAHQKHLAYLNNKAFELQNQEDMLNRRQEIMILVFTRNFFIKCE